jgi:hypothetical protein
MSKQQYTYEDWYNGKVELMWARRNETPNPILVDWDNFAIDDKLKIQETQEAIFNEQVSQTIQVVQEEFIGNYQRTRSKIDLINRLLRRFNSVFNNNVQCVDDIVYTSDGRLNFEFWYYQEMKIYIDRYFIGGDYYDKNNVQSPNSPFLKKNEVLPEVMVHAIGAMMQLLKKLKRQLKVSFQEESYREPLNAKPISNKAVKNPYPDIFSSDEAYEFFCELERLVVVEAEYVAGYAFIFHNLKDEKLDFPIKKNVRQVDFCEFLKDQRGQKEIYPPKLPKRNPKRKTAIFESCKNKYISSIQSTKKSV